jgi:hypothetical protein
VVISNHDSATTRALYAVATFYSVQAYRSLADSQSARGAAAELVALLFTKSMPVDQKTCFIPLVQTNIT